VDTSRPRWKKELKSVRIEEVERIADIEMKIYLGMIADPARIAGRPWGKTDACLEEGRRSCRASW
jgi:hypothetical protein